MIDIRLLKAKILGTDGKIVKKFLNKDYRQKYFTPDEIEFIDALGAPDWEGKLKMAVALGDDGQKAECKTVPVPRRQPLYVYDGKDFFNIEDLARYIYCQKNGIDAVKWVRKNINPKYFHQFRKKTDKDFKRKIYLIETVDDIKTKVYPLRNSNVKIKLFCEKCGRADYQAPKVVLHFGNLYCKSCRRKMIKEAKKAAASEAKAEQQQEEKKE